MYLYLLISWTYTFFHFIKTLLLPKLIFIVLMNECYKFMFHLTIITLINRILIYLNIYKLQIRKKFRILELLYDTLIQYCSAHSLYLRQSKWTKKKIKILAKSCTRHNFLPFQLHFYTSKNQCEKNSLAMNRNFRFVFVIFYLSKH